MDVLRSREWSGNVRELKNVLTRLAVEAGARAPTREMLVEILLEKDLGGPVVRGADEPVRPPARPSGQALERHVATNASGPPQ